MKKKLYNGVAHPAVFSDPVIRATLDLLGPEHEKVLDPFAGVGKVHEIPNLVDWDMTTVGVEIEPEWATVHPDTVVGDALDLPFDSDTFDAIITSPCYGNRLADSHNAKDGSYRRSYTHDLGRTLHENNAGSLHWGQEYRDFHAKAWVEAIRVLKPEGHFFLNISDHIRNKKRVHVASWHVSTLMFMGMKLEDAVRVETRRHKAGANRERVASELVFRLLNTQREQFHD